MIKKIKTIPDSLKVFLRQYTETLLAAIIIAIILRTFFIGAYRVPTSAMSPELQIGDFIFAVKAPIWFAKIVSKSSEVVKRGDVIVFRCPDNTEYYCTKRVLGMPGESIRVINGQPSINGVSFEYEAAQAPNEVSVTEEFYQPYLEKGLGVETLTYQQDQPDGEEVTEVQLKPNEYFVLGDNRNVMDDSRTYGPVLLDHIDARASMIWLSIDWAEPQLGGVLPRFRWSRFFQFVD